MSPKPEPATLLTTLGLILSVRPHFDPTGTKVISCATCKLNGLVKVFALLAAALFATPEVADSTLGVTFAILSVLNYYLSLGIVFAGIYAVAFREFDVWSEFAVGFRVVGRFLGLERVERKSDKWFVVGLVVFFVQYAVVTGYFYLSGSEARSAEVLVYSISNDFATVYEFIVCALYSFYVIQINRMYKGLNDVFEKFTDFDTNHIENGLINFSENKQKNNEITKILKFSMIYRLMYDIVGSLNEIFGLQILLVYCHDTMRILMVFNAVILRVANVMEEVQGLYENFFTYMFCSLISFAIVCVLVSMVCDFAAKEAEKTIYIAYKLQEDYPLESEERKEILKFIKLAENHLPEFTAARFFNMNRRILFSIFSTSTAYLIILIQFNLE